MKMSFRWFGSKYDSVTLKQIKQIPGVKGIITTLYHTKPGEVWTIEDIKKLKKEVNDAGLEIDGIESVNIHDDIKAGGPNRDLYINNYIKTLENLGKENINLVCYNFMPVFDWTRSDLFKLREDGSTVLSYDQEKIDSIDINSLLKNTFDNSNGYIMPGWEPDRLEKIKELFDLYKNVTEEDLFNNLKYFLEKILPTLIKYNIKMAIHPDDPAWNVFNLPRIVKNKNDIERLTKMVDHPLNGITFCSGSYGSNPDNDLIDIIKTYKDRIHFAHLRNIKYLGYKKFDEAAHLSSDGSLDMYEIVKALYEIGFDGPARPDHGRQIWDEVSIPGYGLYDRALGITYLNGLYEAIKKGSR